MSETETIPVRSDEQFDSVAVARFLRGIVVLPSGEIEVSQFNTGSSNLTYLLRSGEHEWVLRRPPLGPLLPTAHDMGREFRILRALEGTGVPAPRAIAHCEDASIIGAPFYVMERLRGFVVATGEEPEIATAEAARAMAFGLVDAAAKLHLADYGAAGLSDFGKPEGFLDRQIARWRKQWLAAKTRELPIMDELHAWLLAHKPTDSRSAIVHGDLSPRNTIFDTADPGRVVALLDWEMATLGDPLCDVGYLLALWPQMDDSEVRERVTPPALRRSGMPSRAELAARYESLTGIAVEDMRFYEVLALYKLAVIIEGIYFRYVKGQTQDERFAGHGERTIATAEAALEASQ